MPKNTSICPHPFSRLSLSKKQFIPCCPSWLDELGTKLDESEDPWSGPTARQFRQRMLDGNFELCHRERCQEPLVDLKSVAGDLDSEGYSLQENTIKSILAGDVGLEDGPSFVSIGSRDNTCNLKCPSCRTQLITKLTKSRKEDFFHSLTLLKKYKNSLRRIRIGDNGEVFYSPRLRRILKICTPSTFPHLKKVQLLTNATLLTEKMWTSCAPGVQWVSEINVSIDAGNEEAYERVRGGNWKQLQKNLKFISSLRAGQKIEHFFLNIAIQLHNYESLDDLIDLAQELRVDALIIHPFDHWEHMSTNEFLARAVHLREHPQHQHFQEVLTKALEHRELKIEIKNKLPGVILEA